MANTRMYLVCKKCNKRIAIAKYYPGTGWYIPNIDNSNMKKQMDEHIDCDYSMFSELFILVYE